MPFKGWEQKDFDAMEVAGFEARMAAIRERVRPKLEALGEQLAPVLGRLAGEPLYPHVARHARRTVNPPDETWCAWSPSPRGYKKHPHFQLGIWADHIFFQAGVIWEAPFRPRLADLLDRRGSDLCKLLPLDFFWKDDHTEPGGIPGSRLRPEDLGALAGGLRRKSKGDLMVGAGFERDEVLSLSPQSFLQKISTVAEQLVPVYRLAREAEEAAAGAGLVGGRRRG